MSYLREDVQELVNNRFGRAEQYAATSLADADAYLTSLANELASFDPDFLDLTVNLPQISVGDYTPVSPVQPELSLSEVSAPTEPALIAVDVSEVTIPSLSSVPPVIIIPDAPTVVTPADPGEAPIIDDDFDYPTRPSISLPTVPTFEEVTMPTKPTVSIPSMDIDPPTIVLDPPESTFSYNENAYTSALATAIETKLMDMLTEGGTGLGADVEDAIWERARNRQQTGNERVYNEALNFFASRGWIMPPGVLAARLREAVVEQVRADADLNRDIAVEQARLARSNLEFIVNSIMSYENIARQYANSIAQRTFEAAKYTQEAAISIFNTRVIKYQLELDAYKTAAQVLETKIRAALLELEQFKVEIEGANLTLKAQELYATIYNLQLQGVQALANIYRTDMESVAIRASVERVRIEAFKEKVNAYSARLAANTSAYNAYQARISGEIAKAQVYESQVRAYSTEIEGVKAQADINVAQANAQVAYNNNLIHKYTADIDKYRADMQANINELQALVASYGVKTQVFNSEVDLARTKVDADIKSFEVQQRHEDNRISLSIKQSEINLANALEMHRLQIEALKAGANISAQLAASAMSSVSAAAQLTYGGGHHYSDSDSNVTQHTYTHSS